MSLELSKNISKLKPSPTLAMVAKINERKAQGKDTISFNIGEPDFDTPEFISDAIIKAIKAGHTRYIDIAGLMDLRKEICKKLERDNNLSYDPTQIIVSTGAKQALFNTVMTLVNEGDRVIIPKPCWVSYEEMVVSVGGLCDFVPTDDNFMPIISEIEKVITTKTKAIILNTPNNPTGAVYSKEVLKAIGDLAVKHNFYIISDEIYEKMIYDDNQHIAIASLSSDIYEQTITINGFAKAYAMTGYRVGYIAAPKNVVKEIINLQGHMTSNANTPTQYGALAALQDGDRSVKEMVEEFRKRRLLCFDILDKIENVKYEKVNGAFYIMIDVSFYLNKAIEKGLVKDIDDFSLYILDKADVAFVSGKAFQAPDYLRMSYSNSQENITKGLQQFKEVLLSI